MSKARGGRYASIGRHFEFVGALLRGQELDRQSIAELVGVQPPMADRLITAAENYLPRVKVRRLKNRNKKTIKIDQLPSTPPLRYPVVVAACFGASLWPLFEGSNYQNGIRDALSDLVARTRRRSIFKNIDRKFWFLRRGGEPALLEHPALLDDVIEGVLHHHPLDVQYTRFDGTVEHVSIEPLSIVVHDHQLYVVGRTPGKRTHLHPYRFSRMKEVEVVEGRTFEYPTRTEYDPAQVFHDSFGIFLNLEPQKVVIHLNERWHTFAKTHRWHVSQVVDREGDHVRIELTVRVCAELEQWILSFGEEAEVISPPELRERLHRRVVLLASRYGAVR